jgi:hypothetical protein
MVRRFHVLAFARLYFLRCERWLVGEVQRISLLRWAGTMPLFFFIIGFVLIDSGFRGNAVALFQQFESDAKGFLAFGAAIIILGALGISPSIRPISKGLLVLVFIVFFLKNGNQVVSGIQSTISASTNNTASPSNSTASSGSTGSTQASSGASGVVGDLNSVASDANSVANDAGAVTSDATKAAGVVSDIFAFASLL